MILLPIENIESFYFSIGKDLKTPLYNILSYIRDTPNKMIHSPLAACIVKVEIYPGEYRLYICLLDCIGIKRVGAILRIKEAGFYYFSIDGIGLDGITLWTHTNNSIQIFAFVYNIIYLDSKGCSGSPYEDWLLWFLGTRQALLSLIYQTQSSLISSTHMKYYRIKLDGLIHDLMNEAKGILNNYPFS